MTTGTEQLHVDVATSSVVLAAFDMGRWPLLLAAVDSIQREHRPGVQIILAVDNNEALYQRALRDLSSVTVVHNEGPTGASATRNAGAALAHGELLVFLDDDAEAVGGWLDPLLEPLVREPDVIGVGGRVLPAWQGAEPRWFPMEFGWVVGASYIGLPEGGGRVRNVWSENMAVRTRDFAGIGGFREGFGKVGHVSRPEDTEFCVRLQASRPASHWWYAPDAVVRHAVPGERATVRFFLRRCYAEGRGKAALAAIVGRDVGLATERAYVARVLPRGVLKGLVRGARGDVWGLAKAAMIVLGSLAAAGGWLREGRGRVRE